jgi:hypothetical protein
LPRRISDGEPPFLLFRCSMKDGVSRHSLPFNRHTADIDAVAENIGVVEDEVAKRRCRNPSRIVLPGHAAVNAQRVVTTSWETPRQARSCRAVAN